MTTDGDRGCVDSSEGGTLSIVQCIGGAEACGSGEMDGSGLARGALVPSSTFIPDALVPSRIPVLGALVPAPTPSRA
jgi:hypothetical protein